MAENHFGEMQMMEEVTEHAGMNYHDAPDSIYVALGRKQNQPKILSQSMKMRAFQEQWRLQFYSSHFILVQLCVL